MQINEITELLTLDHNLSWRVREPCGSCEGTGEITDEHPHDDDGDIISRYSCSQCGGRGWRHKEADKWDRRFLQLAQLVSTWSKDPSTKCGAVIVRPDRTVASLGFNGFPQAMSDAPELYDDRETKYSRVVHCEMNAVLTAHEPLRGCVLYTWPFLSCDRCAVHMIQTGIVRAVAPAADDDAQGRWGGSLEKTKRYFGEANVEFREIDIA